MEIDTIRDIGFDIALMSPITLAHRFLLVSDDGSVCTSLLAAQR